MFYFGFVLGCCVGGTFIWYMKKKIWAAIDALKLRYDEWRK